jgi:hypothetical protein
MSAQQRLQVNLYADADAAYFNAFNTRFPSGVMYPLFYCEETGTVDQAKADMLKSQVRARRRVPAPVLTRRQIYVALRIQQWVFWAGLLISAACTACGVVLLVFTLRAPTDVFIPINIGHGDDPD